jgi:hypothetical protein
MQNGQLSLLTDSKISIKEECVFDDTPELGDSLYETKLQPNLTLFEIEDALFLKQFSRGLFTVTGEPGSGKGLTMSSIIWKMNRYFGKKKVLDYIPRRLFGSYIKFDEMVLSEQIKQMGLQVLGKTNKTKEKELAAQASSQLLIKNKDMFTSAAMGFDEFWKYVGKRRTSSNINYFTTGLVKVLRHYDSCLIGASPSIDELDQQQIVTPVYLSADMRCKWSKILPDTTIVKIRRLKSISTSGTQELDPNHIITYKINGGMRRPEVGLKLGRLQYHEDSITEQAIINYVREHETADLKDIVSVINKDVETCKKWCLSLMHRNYLLGLRYFDLFNSKDQKNIATTKIKTTI